jgi:hypothetical protein
MSTSTPTAADRAFIKDLLVKLIKSIDDIIKNSFINLKDNEIKSDNSRKVFNYDVSRLTLSINNTNDPTNKDIIKEINLLLQRMNEIEHEQIDLLTQFEIKLNTILSNFKADENKIDNISKNNEGEDNVSQQVSPQGEVSRQGGKSNKRKSNKRKSNKRKSNKRKSNKRKSNKRKSNKRKSNKRKSKRRKSNKKDQIGDELYMAGVVAAAVNFGDSESTDISTDI